MTNKDRKNMLLNWISDINPKAVLRRADVRCGSRYAVVIAESPRDYGKRITEYLPLKELEQYLLGVFHASEFTAAIKLGNS